MAVLDLNATLGALEIGFIISVFLFGVVTLQAYIYAHNCSRDHIALRMLVFLIWVLEATHTICVAYAIYTVTILEYGQPEKLVRTPTGLDLSVAFSGCVGPLVQSFYANRVRKFSGNWFIAVFCWVLCLLRVVGALAIATEAFLMVSFSETEARLAWLLTSVLVIGVCVDGVIAMSLCYYLRKQRNLALRRTAKILDTILAWSIQTGLLTSITTIAQLITFLTMKNNYVWIAVSITLTRFYSNSLLATLNGREKLRAISSSTAVSLSSVCDAACLNLSDKRHVPSFPVIDISGVKVRDIQLEVEDGRASADTDMEKN